MKNGKCWLCGVLKMSRILDQIKPNIYWYKCLRCGMVIEENDKDSHRCKKCLEDIKVYLKDSSQSLGNEEIGGE